MPIRAPGQHGTHRKTCNRRPGTIVPICNFRCRLRRPPPLRVSSYRSHMRRRWLPSDQTMRQFWNLAARSSSINASIMPQIAPLNRIITQSRQPRPADPCAAHARPIRQCNSRLFSCHTRLVEVQCLAQNNSNPTRGGRYPFHRHVISENSCNDR